MATNGKNNKKKKKIIIFSALGLLLVIVIVAIVLGGKKDEIIAVQTEKVQRRTITQVVEATGKIQPQTQVKINAEVSGEIIELPVEEGDVVKKGQLLVRIKPDQYIAQRDQAIASLNRMKAMLVQGEADFRKVENDYKRQQELFSKGLISESDLEASRSRFEIAKANVDASRFDVQNAQASLSRTREDLAKTAIYSPIDGVVTQRISKLGERVSGSSFMQGTEIMTVSDLSVMEARVEVNENDVVLISIGDTARIEVDAYPDHEFIATVYQIANTATTTGLGTQEEVTNFEVRLIIDAEGKEFRPGMSSSAKIQTETRANVLTVPLQSVTTREAKDRPEGGAPGGDGEEEVPATVRIEGVTDTEGMKKEKPQEVVFVIRDGLARKVAVTTGISSDAYIEVAEGLAVGDEVVKGSYRAISRELNDSSRVRIDNKLSPRAASGK
ncbi:MAG: efflux RND transporter periplasmic adaptor subunit [Bacteroidota bacterium]|jgi:HlyD family secretion protein|nr:efflux RND transporter periplasmic adaptor subunit [Bacteroidota bacterium]